ILDDARGPVSAAARLVGRGDLPGDGRVLPLPGTGLVLPPAVVAAGRDTPQPAQPADRVVALHRFNLGIPLSGVSESMPTDFFSTISRSRIRISSARNRPISFSASASVCGAGPLS